MAIGKTQIQNMTMGLAESADRPIGIMGIGRQLHPLSLLLYTLLDLLRYFHHLLELTL